jgi:DNA-binding CsgD family transcriptional regulator
MRHPNDDLETVARRAGVSVDDAQTALAVLVDAQLLSRSTRPTGAAPIDPKLAIETHIARAERDIAVRSAELSNLRARVAEFAEDYMYGRAKDPSPPLVEIVSSLDDVRRRIYLASEGARSIQRSLIRSPSAEGLDHGKLLDLDQQERGVERRTIIGATDLADPAIFAHFEDQHGRGERVRALGTVPTQMLVMDDTVAVLAVDPINPRHGAIFVQEPGILQLLIYLFDRLWSDADAVFNEVVDGDAPIGRSARILELMASGIKDEKIARSLGIGSRSVRREIAVLRDRLGVASRTEVITAAIKRGWL